MFDGNENDDRDIDIDENFPKAKTYIGLVPQEITLEPFEQVINTVVERNFPGVNAAPVSNCVVDNATGDEIVTVAEAAVTGIDDETVATVLDVVKRRDTIDCIASNGIALLG